MFKPQLYYALHFTEGAAQYHNLPGAPIIMVNGDAMRKMDATYTGCPVFVEHVNNVNERDPDGIVVRSFFNKSDGKHWTEFLVNTQKGVDAIKAGYKVSNSYKITGRQPGGRWHGIDYGTEVTNGEYDHLALVKKPRYRESIVLTPEEFKRYNEEKEAELYRIANSEEKEEMMFFKKEKVNNAEELKNMSVQLPQSKKEISVADLIKNADEAELKKDEKKMANGDEIVKVDDEDITVSDLMNKYSNACKRNSELEEEKKQNSSKKKNTEDKDKKDNTEDKDKKDNTDDKDKMKNSEETPEQKAAREKQEQENFDKIKNAEAAAAVQNSENNVFLTDTDRTALGKKRYGN